MRRRRKDVPLWVKIVLLSGSVLILIVLLLYDKYSTQRTQEYLHRLHQEELEKRAQIEKDLYITRDNCDFWTENTPFFTYEVVADANQLENYTEYTSAYLNNAQILIDMDGTLQERTDAQYIWRFWASSTNEKEIAVFNGGVSETFIINEQATQFYIEIENPNRIRLEVLDGDDNFGEIRVGDSQIILVEDQFLDVDNDCGQFLCDSDARKLLKFNTDMYQTVAMTDSRGEFEKLLEINEPQNMRVRLQNGNYVGELRWSDFANIDLNIEARYLIDFNARLGSGSGKFTLDINNGEYYADRSITSQYYEYAFPLTDLEEINSLYIKMDLGEGVAEFDNFSIYSANGDSLNFPGGSYLVEPYENIELLESDKIADSAIACLVDDDYLYSLRDGSLIIYQLLDNGSVGNILSSTNELGDIREMIFIKNKSALAITSRENGVYFVDISDKSAPVVCSNYDTLGMATGISSVGNYIAVCGRFFGTEIIDISDLYQPSFCSCVSNIEEYYDCFMTDGYLYVSVWANRCIEVYDLANVYNPKSINRITLDGNGGGCYVENDILYVATGYCREGEADDEFDSAFGTGTGLEIFDVSDPENIEWISACMIDGRYYIAGFDHWKVIVSNGIAYLSSVSNGIYIFDVSNPYQPIRTEHIGVSIAEDSDAYKPLSSVYILPEGGNGGDKEIITDIALSDGRIYFSGYRGGIYSYDYEAAAALMDVEGELSGQKLENQIDVRIPGYECEYFMPENGSVYAVQEYSDRIYVACGSDGILVLDQNLNIIEKHATESAVMDIQIENNFLYSAEAESGIGVYMLSDNGLTKVGMCNSSSTENILFSQLQVMGNGNHILAQAGWTFTAMIDVSDPRNPIIENEMSPGLLYSRNLCNGNVLQNGISYSAVFSRNRMVWYDGDGNEVVNYPVNLVAESDGASSLGDKVLVMNNRGYLVFDPLTIDESSIESLQNYGIEGEYLRGKPSIYEDLMVVSYGYGKKIFLVDIQNIEEPELIAQTDVEGNPDIAEITDDTIYIPLRRGGLLVLREEE